MTEQEWREAFGRVVVEGVKSPEFDRFFSVKFTRERAKISLLQLGLFIKHRRDCWAFVSGNCPEMSVKQQILAHEYDEIVKDRYSDFGHMELIVRQARTLGLTPEQALNVEPLPSTRATLYAWGWMTRERPWLEGLAALMATEWGNDDRLFEDLGGGVSRREGIRWVEDMGLQWEQIPNLSAHAEADEAHGEMFVPVLAVFGNGNEQKILQAARESMELYRVFRLGLALAMEAI
ncbi:MAG TPA: iron-containing redox enzyme family protein [Candidatus Binatia bacterium]|jgi:pyrroloquinoline quinone (PQQ) biosynthesis protein C